MLTEEQALTELRQLNQELGLPEDDGMPMTQAQAEAELRALDEQLASTPESFGEYVERRKVEDSRSLGDKTAAFTESFMTGAGALASEGSKAISELFAGDVGTSEVGGVFQVGINDFGRFAKTLGGAAMDNFYSDEGEMQREYQRYKDNFLYNQEVRPAMLETYDEEGRDFVSFGANFVDPALLVPAAGLIAKGGSLGAKAVALGAKGISKGAKAGAFAARSPRLVQLSRAMARTSRGAEKVAKGAKKVAKGLDKASEVASIPAKLAASGTRKAIKGSAFVGSKIAGGVAKTGELASKTAALPRNIVTGLASKVIDPKIAGSGILGAQATGVLTGAVPGLGLLTGTEALGYIANKTGRGVERTLSALSSTGGQKRFLQRLATTANSPRLRKLALMAHAGGATKLTDLAFNSLVNGASVGVLNGALAYASGEGAEGVGAAVGSGTLMGGSLPFGQPGMKGGKSQAARDQSSINFLNAKLADDQIKQFKNLSPDARLAFATVEEAGIRAPKLAFLDKQTYLDFLRQDDPNLRQAPNAHYDMGDNTIYVNQDGNAGRSSKEAMDILTHELGHHFITQGIKDDPLFARKILEQYEAKPGEESFDFAFTTDSAGSPIDSIQLNADAKKISDGYDSIQSGDQSISVGMNANKLAQEIGAEQFAMMMVDNPNIFNTIEPSLRQKLLDGSRKVLTMFGAVDPYTGNPLDISISPILKRNKQVRNLYKNYIKQREKSIVDKVDLAEKGVAIKVRKGESADQAVERMFGAQGISLKDSGAFRITNKKVKEKLSQILNRLDEQPEGPMSSERNPRSDKPQSIVGKELSPELRNVFTRNDPRGTINVLINDITESIRDRIQLNFLYRSGKPSKYSDNELKGRVVSPVRFKVTGLSKGSRSAASLKMDAIDEAYLRNNVEVLVKEGFAKDPNKLIEQAREVARQALDNEGKINPEGNFENELITALFGQKESAPQIKDARLRELLAAKDSKLQHAYRSYDIDALAGIAPTGKSGIAFDWFNIKNNYSPFDDKLFIPAFHGTPHTLAPEAGAPLGKFRTSKIGTGEGAQAYGHGLYFAGKREVAEHYRKVLTDDKNPSKSLYDGQPYDPYNKKHNASIRLKRAGGDRSRAIKSLQDSIYLEKAPNPSSSKDPFLLKQLEETLEVIKNKQEAKANEGSLYKVELAPKENEYLLWDKPLSEQPKAVREKIEKVAKEKNIPVKQEEEFMVIYDSDARDKFHFEVQGGETGLSLPNITKNSLVDLVGKKTANRIISDLGKQSDVGMAQVVSSGEVSLLGKNIYKKLVSDQSSKQTKPLGKPDASTSAALKEAGIPGIKYLDGASRSKGEGDYNYVIFDEADVTVTEKLFMPASEAGATKGKVAEAAKLWNEKGIDSPYFKKWFDKSKVVDENGEPLVVYHGTDKEFTAFDPEKSIGGQHWFTSDKSAIESGEVGAQGKGVIMETYLNIKKPAGWAEYDKFTIDELLGRGYDGLILPESDGTATYVAYSPEQIKSATGNRGTFDAGERDILFMPANKLYGPVENIGGIRLKRRTRGLNTDVAVVGRGKDTKEYYLHDHKLPDEVAAQAIEKHGDHGAQNLLAYVANGNYEVNAPKSLKAWSEIQERFRKETEGNFNLEKLQKQKILKAWGEDPVDLIRDTIPQGTKERGIYESEGVVYLGEKSQSSANIKKDGLKVQWEESSNISKSIYPTMKIELKNGTSFYEQVRISDHNQVSDKAPRYYEYDYRAKNIQDALPEIEGDMQQLAWDMWNDQKNIYDELKGKSSKQFMPSDSKAPKAQPANRVQQQAPSMPNNRFMAPAASAGAKLSERFNR